MDQNSKSILGLFFGTVLAIGATQVAFRFIELSSNIQAVVTIVLIIIFSVIGTAFVNVFVGNRLPDMSPIPEQPAQPENVQQMPQQQYQTPQSQPQQPIPQQRSTQPNQNQQQPRQPIQP